MAIREHSLAGTEVSTPKLESIRIRGFRSFADVEIEVSPNVTVLIGPNGSGKSNLFRFFELCGWMLRSRKLGEFVARQGGADDQLFRGRKVTPQMEAELSVRTEAGRSDYRFALAGAQSDRLIFAEESIRCAESERGADAEWRQLGSGHAEARLVEAAQSGVRGDGIEGVDAAAARAILDLAGDCVVYQFHDTSDSSRFQQLWDVSDCARLRSHGGNLAPVLLRLERENFQLYDLICRQIGRMVPGFECFELVEQYGKVALRWKAKGSEKTYGAHLTSDGSLRLFALATLLYLPPEMLPSVVLLDEPELGLHPAAVELVGHMIKRAGRDRQVIVATQESCIVDVFDLDQLVVLDLEDGRTVCRRFDPAEYWQWFDDGYTTGNLWHIGLLGGNP